MKVGVISKGSPDYLIDIVCDGLIKILGRNNVALDYQHKSRWGGQYSILMAGVEQENSFDIHDADVLVASDRSIPAMEAWIQRTGRKKIAFIDGEDGESLKYEPSLVSIYFKREYISGGSYPSNVRPLPFAAIPEPHPKEAEITREVFYMGHASHPIRLEVADALTKMGHPVQAARIEKEPYNKLLISSLVGIAPRGFGWDTYRYWEIPFFGCALLAQRSPIVIPENFEDGNEAVFFDNVPDMVSKLNGLLKNPEATLAMASRGHEACLKRHLCTNRAKTVLEAIA